MIFTHNQTKIINFSIDKIYNIIADVPSYKEFIKWIKDINELPITNTDSLNNSNSLTIKNYKITVGFGFLEESFITKDIFIKNQSIKIELIEGAFKTLNSIWNFKEIEKNKTEVSFLMDFSFKSIFIEKMFSQFFLLANEKITDAFIKRAEDLYGKNNLIKKI
jgi:coenzyme Q-binding protein COQ10